jgi:hypothetical protein
LALLRAHGLVARFKPPPLPSLQLLLLQQAPRKS